MYKNFIEHEYYGNLWYVITVRNWNAMGNTVEENLRSGPCVVMSLVDYGLVTSGKTIAEAIYRMQITLDVYQKKTGAGPESWGDLPVNHSSKVSWWKIWRLKRLFKKFERDGTTNPVR